MVLRVPQILGVFVCLLAGCSSDPSASFAPSTEGVSLPTSMDVRSGCKGTYSVSASNSFTPGAGDVARDGSGLALRLTLVDPRACLPLDKIEVDVWHTGTGETYSSSWRSKQYTGPDGVVRYETVLPSKGEGNRHIHVRGVHEGFLYWWVIMVPDRVSPDAVSLDVVLVLASVRSDAAPEFNY